MLGTLIGLFMLIVGILLMTISSDKAVKHSVIIASALGVSPFMIGLLLVSIGTDLPEIVNSIVSSALGHGDINVGDSVGSVLTQSTLVLALLAFFGGSFKIDQKEIVVAGVCELLALILLYPMVEKGYFTRIDAALLIGSWPLYMVMVKTITDRKRLDRQRRIEAIGKKAYHITMAILGFIGVALGASIAVESILILSAAFKVPEYLISFFLAAIGTSLPELAVDIVAIRRKESEIVAGDIIGSCIIDAGLSIGIGQLLFPGTVTAGLASVTILYTLFASATVILTLAIRERMDRSSGFLFALIYMLSYIILALNLHN